MNDQQIQNQLVERYVALQTWPTRLSLSFHVRMRRWLWRWLTAGGAFAKRAFDIISSGLFLIVFSPLYLAIIALVRLEDGHSAFFKQIRVGRNGRHFKMYKFRSMCPDAEQRLAEVLSKNQHGGDAITFKIKDDPRLTRVGKWLRKFSFDELPQVWNVFIGDMSLVGPRPPLPREVARYSLADRRRLAVQPGITCLWQIGGRAEIDFKGQVKLDVTYIENQKFWGDVKILFKTIPAVASGRGAC